MNERKLHQILQAFVQAFNEMVVRTGRNYMVVPDVTYFEGTPGTLRYPVTYHLKRKEDGWDIFAKGRKPRLPLRTFPLLKISQKGPFYFFHGLYTQDFPPMSLEEVPEQLNRYLHICEQVDHHAFTHV